jgi:4-hydroxyacetophenone monooxygenase
MSNPDKVLRNAIECANLPTLLAVMSHLSGDEKWLAAPYLPNPVPPELLADDSGGFNDEIASEIRISAFDVIKPYVDKTKALPPSSQSRKDEQNYVC